MPQRLPSLQISMKTLSCSMPRLLLYYLRPLRRRRLHSLDAGDSDVLGGSQNGSETFYPKLLRP